jgi:hypothetical protein
MSQNEPVKIIIKSVSPTSIPASPSISPVQPDSKPANPPKITTPKK